MSKITMHSGSNLPKLGVYNLKGVLVATSYKRHASGQIQFWHFRDKKLLTMPMLQFETHYQTRLLMLV